MFRIKKKKNGIAAMQYVLLMLAVMGAFLMFRDYIFRGIAGRWKTVGDSYGMGRQYDPDSTKECTVDTVFFPGTWYDVKCAYNHGCRLTNNACMSASISACRSGC